MGETGHIRSRLASIPALSRLGGRGILVTFATGIALVGLVGVLLFKTYRFSVDLRQKALEHATQESRIQAISLGHFFAGARDELKKLGQANELRAYYESQALGMSWEYGLGISLESVRNRFESVIEGYRAGGRPVYSRIVLSDRQGRVLIHSSADGVPMPPVDDFAPSVPLADGEVSFHSTRDGRGIAVYLRLSFKGAHQGWLVAWIDPAILRDKQLPEDVHNRHGWLLLESASGGAQRVLFPTAGPLPDLSSLQGEPAGRAFLAPSAFPDDAGGDMVAVRTPVPGTPFSRVDLFGGQEAVGPDRPERLIYGLVAISVVLLGGLALAIVSHSRSMLLSARLEESRSREALIEEKNLQLENEVAERARAVSALQDSEERFRSLISNVQDVITVIDRSAKITYVSPACAHALGYAAEEMVGKFGLQFLHPDDAPRAARAMDDREWSPEVPHRTDYRFVTRDGRIRIFETIGQNRLQDPLIQGFVLTFRDVTERRRVEEANTLLSTAVEQAGESIMITDTSGTILYVNPAFEKVTGYSRDEAIGNNPRILRSGTHDRDHYQRMWNTLASGGVWSGSFLNYRKDGTLFEESAVISPVRDGEGRIVRYVAVKRDMTREHELAEQLRQSQKMEAVGKLAGGIAHDFNNLLTAINGYADMLISRAPPESPVRRDAMEILSAGERAAALTRQLLAFSRRQVLQPKVLDLDKVVGGMQSLLQRVIGEDIALEIHGVEGLWQTRADPGQLEQVIMNLVVNARDAMPRGGRVVVETANRQLDAEYVRSRPVVRPGPYVEISVSDTGDGMTPETQARIFEPFFSTKGPGKGTGLGLSTVYGIVKQSQGYIWVYSELGKGTVFKIYLPKVEGEARIDRVEPKESEPPNEGAETVLLAEDESMVRELARVVLESKGYRVIEASDGNEALRTCRGYDGPIHLLLTDVVMPRMGGVDLAEQVVAARPDMRILFMSGYAENAIVSQGILKPGASFISKPFRPSLLASKVREVLDA